MAATKPEVEITFQRCVMALRFNLYPHSFDHARLGYIYIQFYSSNDGQHSYAEKERKKKQKKNEQTNKNNDISEISYEQNNETFQQ
jgi:hypothetical protein